MQPDQIEGPGWLDDVPFDIIANAPPGTRQDQIRQMMQTLLQERFKLKFHVESQNRMVNVLTVLKGGPILRAAQVGSTSSGALPEKDGVQVGKGSSIEDRLGRSTTTSSGKFGKFKMVMNNGIIRNEFESMTMPSLADYLGQVMRELPVVDRTALTGAYQISIELDAAGMLPQEQGGGLQAEPSRVSIPDQLKKMGLALARQRLADEKYVIDNIDRIPTEN